jgi:hypothetical protein
MRPGKVEPVKLVVSIFSSEPALISDVLVELKTRFGDTDFLSEPVDFDFTAYYEGEFGKGLRRRLASFEELIDPSELARIKLETNALEDRYLGVEGKRGKRRVNIDPGYLTLERLVLASCKNFSHRIYLGSGVYGDLTLLYSGEEYRALEWTYPDYAGAHMRGLFKEIRERYAEKIGRGKRGRRPKG